MLLVKCGQCGASYKLSEELYRRKAAGFGVVVTCRRCKTEIHVEADAGPAPEEAAAESDAVPTAPLHERPDPPTNPSNEAPAGKTPGPAAAKVDDAKAATGAVPLVAKPPPRAAGVPPRPAAATVKGLGVDAVKAAGAQKSADTKATSPTPPAAGVKPSPTTPKVGPVARTAPKLVALSPGLLGTSTALKPKAPPSPASPSPPAVAAPAPATASPSPPAAAKPPPVAAAKPPPVAAAKPARALDDAWDASIPAPPPDSSAADSEIPVASQDFLPSDPAPASAVSVDSTDFVADPPSAVSPPAPETAAKAKDEGAAKKRLPEAPAAKRIGKAEPKPEELPSTTGTPKLDTLVHGKAVPLEQKKGEPARPRLPSGDLSDDFMSADLGFDAPALLPPSADALTRAPVSSRPAGVTPQKSPSKPSDAKGVAPKSASPVTVKADKRAGGGRGWVALLLLAVLGVGGFAFRDRLRSAPVTRPEGANAVAPPKAEPAAAETAVAAPPAPVEEPGAPSADATGEGPTAAAATAASPATPSGPTSESTAEAAVPPAPGPRATTPPATAPSPPAAAPPSTAPAAIRPTAAPVPTPAVPAPKPTVIEPRPSVGTEPFDAAAARAALDASATQASSCRKPGDPSGVAVVIITFSPTGRVTTANINGPPFAATPTGGCIASTLRKTRVPAFAGDMVTVRKTVTIH